MSKSKAFVFTVSRSKADVVGTITVLHTNRQDAAFAAIREVRREKSIPSHVALFATQKTQA